MPRIWVHRILFVRCQASQKARFAELHRYWHLYCVISDQLHVDRYWQLARKGNSYKICEARSLKMNSDQLEGKWKQVKGEVREKWGQLTDDDIHVIAGRRDQLIGRIQERYGIAKEAATREVDTFLNKLNAESGRVTAIDEREEHGKSRSVGQG